MRNIAKSLNNFKKLVQLNYNKHKKHMLRRSRTLIKTKFCRKTKISGRFLNKMGFHLPNILKKILLEENDISKKL